MLNSIEVGSKIFFGEDKNPFTVKAKNERFAICTKPFNLKKTVLYTIVDFEERIRGVDSFVFGVYDYAIQADIDKVLGGLADGTIGISYSNRVPLEIKGIK